jgi:hypothetical protein
VLASPSPHMYNLRIWENLSTTGIIWEHHLDIRMRCYAKDYVYNFHLLASPMRERHKRQYQIDLMYTAFDVITRNCRLIGIPSDGANTMT